MSWTVEFSALNREDLPAVLNEHRVSRSGHVPDIIVDIIAAEVGTLDAKFTKAKVTSSGCLGEGATRNARFSVEGSS